jgi:oligopeptidase B
VHAWGTWRRKIYAGAILKTMTQETKVVNANASSVESASTPAPPAAHRKPVEHVVHGDRREDDYAWLREKENPDVIAYLKAEDAYSDAMLKSTEPLQEKLYQEMLGRIQQTDLSVPYRLRGYWYFTRTEEGKQYPIYCRCKTSSGHESIPQESGAPEEILLDLNVLAEGHSFLGLGAFDVSDDNHLLAYSLDTTGFRQYTLHIKDLRTGETRPERIERFLDPLRTI